MVNVRGTVLSGLVLVALAFALGGCSTAPKQKDRAQFVREADTAMTFFKQNVGGLDAQLDSAAGYTVFPGIGQWGLIFTGGKTGRGLVRDSSGDQIGWAAVNTFSAGLQAGVQGFKMLVIFEDQQTLNDFKAGKLSGSASAVAVAANTGGSGTAQFVNGVAVYQGANSGLMAGVNVGLDYMRFEPLSKYPID